MKHGLSYIFRRFAASIFLLLLISPAKAANIIIGGDYTDLGTIVVVSPKLGDTATANGTALLNTLAGITTASETQPYLIKLGPGTYDLGAFGLQMKQYVSVEGSGEKATKITSAPISDALPPTIATVLGVNDAELRSLTVENTSAGTNTIGILNLSSSPSLSHLTIIASGGMRNYGIYNSSSSPTMKDVTVTATGWGGPSSANAVYNTSSSPIMIHVNAVASGGSTNDGILNDSSSSPTMTNVTVSASGGTGLNYGIVNTYSSSPTMTNVTANASGVPGSTNYGIVNSLASSSPAMTNVIATASGDSSVNCGIVNTSSAAPTMTNVTATASGASSNNCGMSTSASSGNYTILIDRCSFIGSTNSILLNDSHYTLKIGASKLDGPISGAMFSCVGSYNGSYIALNASCL
ncbi:MAG: hypothetical protein M0024_01885 [Nitrospiraceae bacterium]|nr:hypothetical protein [Nitrospiraceae bacterium]